MKPTLILTLACLFLTSCARSPEAKRDPNSIARIGYELETTMSAQEREVLKLINELRVSLGREPLEFAADVQTSAIKHNLYIRKQSDKGLSCFDSMTHEEGTDPNAEVYSSWGRIGLENANYLKRGEVLAYGNESAADTFQQWLKSPGHYRVMVNAKYRYVGITRVASKNCRYFWTANFAAY